MFTYSTKRQRDEDLVVDFHDRKRPRPLIVQPSDLSQKAFLPDTCHLTAKFDPPTLTPVESSDDDDESKPVLHHSQSTGELQHHEPLDAGHSPMDIDSNRASPILNGGSNMHLWSTRAQGNNNIQPSPIPHSLINESLTITDRHPLSPFPSQVASPAGEQSATRQRLSHAPGLHPFNQRLPSPVSEGEDMQANRSGSSGNMDMTVHSLDTRMESNGRPHNARETTSSNKGLSQTSTAKPGKKKKAPLAMGFRADCDKCRQKVPGHYSHIIHA